jgi:RimJ/RimL family protein N-acetyltransferase
MDPSPLTNEESDNVATLIRKALTEREFGFWAVEAPGVCNFIGFVGLGVPDFKSHFTPCVEAGWRLLPEYWGRGYASEGACAAFRHAFEILDLPELVAFTEPANRRSIGVMERIGMTRSPADDFEHPDWPKGHPIRHHVLYRMTTTDWMSRQ